MGLLDQVIGALGQGGQGGDMQAQLIQAVLQMLMDNGGSAGAAGAAGAGGLGGLGGLLSRLQQGGLGDAAASWVGTGENQPVAPSQLESALGSDVLAQLARQLGVGQSEVAGPLAQVLPQMVDRMTPQGRLPAGGMPDLGQLGGLLGGLLGPR